MRKKWIFIGAAFALAMTLTGCRDNAAASIPQQSSQEQTQMIPMEEAQEAALKAADIVAADADISATTLSEVAGVACYKVEFTSGEYAYAYTINAETGAVMEMSSQEQNAQASGTQTETTDPAAPAPAQNATGTGTVDEAAAQKIALYDRTRYRIAKLHQAIARKTENEIFWFKLNDHLKSLNFEAFFIFIFID